MYRRILFAVDDDEALPAAIPVVAAYTRRWRGEVHVLHVHRIDQAGPSGASRRLVDAVVDRLLAEGIDADGEIRLVHRQAEVAAAVARIATDDRVDLVVVGSHGRSDLAAAFLGSVSRRVAADLDAPLLVVRASGGASVEPARVLVAVDGSPASDQAVAEAAAVASAFGAEVLVLHVQLLITGDGAVIVEPETEAQAIVDRAVADLTAREIRTTGRTLVHRDVAAAIVETAGLFGADLVVLGSRRPSGIGGLLLGSVGHEVVHRLRRPVLLGRRVRAGEPVR